MYEDIFESIRKEAAKRNLRESTANAYCNSVGYFLRTVNKVPMELTALDVDAFLTEKRLGEFESLNRRKTLGIPENIGFAAFVEI